VLAPGSVVIGFKAFRDGQLGSTQVGFKMRECRDRQKGPEAIVLPRKLYWVGESEQAGGQFQPTEIDGRSRFGSGYTPGEREGNVEKASSAQQEACKQV
jgi:hypothetical protein